MNSSDPKPESTPWLLTRKPFLPVFGALFALLVIVEWSAQNNMSPPLIEVLMVGAEGQNSISFVRPGIVLQSE